MIKNLPAMQETQVQFLGLEDPLEKAMATHSSILAQIIPWTEKPGRQQSMGLQKVGHDWATNPYTHPYLTADFSDKAFAFHHFFKCSFYILCGQSTQEDYSLVLCLSFTRAVPASPKPYIHDWPSSVLAKAPAGDCSYQRVMPLYWFPW